MRRSKAKLCARCGRNAMAPSIQTSGAQPVPERLRKGHRPALLLTSCHLLARMSDLGYFEYEAVLTRPQHLAACGLSSAEIGRVLDDLAAVARPVGLRFDGGQGYPILMTTWFWKRQ